MEILLLLPALIQGLAMVVDEFYYHHRRGLGRWERIGHPIDTLGVMATYIPLVIAGFSQTQFIFFLGLGIFSSILVTKDEFVHQRECLAGEQWLHSLLFVLHPLVFVAAGVSWYLLNDRNAALWGSFHWATPDFLRVSLLMQLAAVTVVFVYQTIYWNYLWKPQANK